MPKQVAGKSLKKNELEINVSEILDFLRFSGHFAFGLRELAIRKIAITEARKKGIKVSDKELQKAADDFRLENGLCRARETHEWLKANGLTIEVLENFLESNLLVEKLKDKLEHDTAKEKFHAAPGIKSMVREMIFQEWISKQMK
ncbi:MAG: hypothetical protein PHW04_16715 [Candidatus Wallbacteria bacterium]|nr:hypothetical protein [Candidatus Wallbacteria bacterium]